MNPLFPMRIRGAVLRRCGAGARHLLRLTGCVVAAVGLALTPVATAAQSAPTATPAPAPPTPTAGPSPAPTEAAPVATGQCPETNPNYLSACGPTFTLPQWDDFGGWDQRRAYATIQLGKVGDRPALLGRSSVGVWVERFDPTRGQWAMVGTDDGGVALPLTDQGGWNNPSWYQTLQTATLNGAGVLQFIPAAKDYPRVVRGIALTAHALGAVAEGLGLRPTPSPASSYATITNELAKIQQRERDLTEAQRRYTLADYGLLMTVGSMVNGRLLTLDTTAMLSAGRQSFAGWIDPLYVPAYWNKFVVENCIYDDFYFLYCPTPSGPNVRVSGHDFVALLPPAGSGCDNHFFWVTCAWASPGELGDKIWGRVSDDCIYSPAPGSTAAWRYGCNIGANIDDLFNNRNGWFFGTTSCTIRTRTIGSLCGAGAAEDASPTPPLR